MKQIASLLILPAIVSFLILTQTAYAGLSIDDGMSVSLGAATISLDCSDLTVKNGGILSLNTGKITSCRNVTLEPGSALHDGSGVVNTNGLWTNDSSYVQSGTDSVVRTSACGVLNRATGTGDTDGDGMPDAWEDQYNLKPFEDDANGDKDNDGILNLAEFQNNTNPDFNEPPIFTSQAAFSINETLENTSLVIHDVQANNGNGGATDIGVTYAITGGNESGFFAIDNPDGEIRLTNAGAGGLNYEQATSYTFKVQANDGATTDQTITVTVNDVAPNISTSQSFSVSEGAGNTDSVGTVVNTGDTDSVVWTITGGNTGSAFNIDPATGELTVNDTSGIDYESCTSFTLGIKASDGTIANDATQNVTVNVTNLDEAPTLTATGSTPSFIEGGVGVSLFSGAAVSAVESGQDITQIMLSVTHVYRDGRHEFITVDGTDIALGTTETSIFTTRGFSCSVTLSSEVATLTISKSDTPAAYQTLINGLKYKNTLSDVDSNNRGFTLTSIKDTGSNTGNHADDTALNYQDLRNTLGFKATLNPFDHTKRTVAITSISDSGQATGKHQNQTGNLAITSIVKLSNTRIAVSDIDVTEGDSDTINAVFAVSLTAASWRPITIDFATSSSTAIVKSDYLASSGSLSFQPGESEKSVIVQVVGDIKTEAEESFSLLLSNPVNVLLEDNQGVCVIADNDPDTDGDGMSDKWEIRHGLNPDSPDDKDADKDGDGIPNIDEYTGGTSPDTGDTDKDGLSDKWETDNAYDPTCPDSDANGVNDGDEDPDNDGVINQLEEFLGTDPNNEDSDNNGVNDGEEDPDGDGITTLDEINKGLNPGVNEKPEAVIASPTQTIDETVSVILDGTGSSDPDDGIASYLWEEIRKNDETLITLSGADTDTATFTSPQVKSGGQTFTFRLTVTDKSGQTASVECIVNVTFDNDPPTAEAGEPMEADGGTIVELSGLESTDSDGSIASYAWKQTKGTKVDLENPDTASPRFTAPVISAEETLEFTLTVTDDMGLVASDTVEVTVKANESATKIKSGNDSPDLHSCFITAASDKFNCWFIIASSFLALSALIVLMQRKR